jgi:hypothetical protein
MIQLGKAIYTILSGNTAVRNVVGTKIYPLVIPAETLAPIICYERSATSDYTRDQLNGFVNTVDITVISDDYTESINIAVAVNNALSNYKGTVQGVNVVDVRIENIAETYAENSFMQKLTFTVRAN